MHRRARHLTGRASEAALYFDARRISASDGDAIQTWSDLSTNANDATQATSGKRPLYKVNISGGSPMLLWDNSDDALQCSSAAALTSAYTCIIVGKVNVATGQADNFLYYGNYNGYSPNYNWVGIESYSGNFSLGNYNNPTNGNVAATADTNYNVLSGVVNDSSVNRFFIRGVASGTNTTTAINISTSARPTLGAWGNASSDVLNGYMGVVGYWSSALSASLRRRYEQACSFAWKVPCS